MTIPLVLEIHCLGRRNSTASRLLSGSRSKQWNLQEVSSEQAVEWLAPLAQWQSSGLLIHWLAVRARRGAPCFDLKFCVKRGFECFTIGYCSNLCSNCADSALPTTLGEWRDASHG